MLGNSEGRGRLSEALDKGLSDSGGAETKLVSTNPSSSMLPPELFLYSANQHGIPRLKNQQWLPITSRVNPNP